MLIQAGKYVLHTSQIVSAEPLASVGGRARWSVTLMNGKTIAVDDDSFSPEELCGTIVPAPPGLTLIEAFVDDHEGNRSIDYLRSAVIAFRVTPGRGEPSPIGARGEPLADSTNRDYAVMQPDGSCFGWEQVWPTFEEFAKHCEGMLWRRQ